MLGITLDIVVISTDNSRVGIAMVGSLLRLLRILELIPSFFTLFAALFHMIGVFTPLIPVVAAMFW